MSQVTEIIRWWLILNVLFVFGYDYIVIVYYPNHLTISLQLQALIADYPVLLVAIGTIVGHLFWK